jgi:serine/threonine protein kinase
VDAAGHAILTDFGRAKMIGDVFYSTPLMAGTAQYMAPELLNPTEEVDIDELFSKQSDVYAFGILSYEVTHIVTRKL